MNGAPEIGVYAFARRVGIIAGAVLAVITASNMLGGFIFRQAMAPITREIQRQVTEERIARVEADEKLTESLNETAALLVILDAPAGVERARRIARLRATWEQQQKTAGDKR